MAVSADWLGLRASPVVILATRGAWGPTLLIGDCSQASDTLDFSRIASSFDQCTCGGFDLCFGSRGLFRDLCICVWQTCLCSRLSCFFDSRGCGFVSILCRLLSTYTQGCEGSCLWICCLRCHRRLCRSCSMCRVAVLNRIFTL